MSKITQTLRRAGDFLSSRVGARMLLILSCFVCVFVFTPYIRTVEIFADGDTQTYITMSESDPVELFTQVGLSLDAGDQYYEIRNEVTDQSELHILRAFTITITDSNVTGTYDVTGGTVGEALDTAGVARPDSDDEISYSLDDEVFSYMDIVINRVEYKDKTETVAVMYQTLKHETDSLYKGQTKVKTQGVNGQKQVTKRQKWVNGEYASEVILDEKIIAQPVNEIIDVGTATPPTTKTASTPTGVLSAKQTSPAKAISGTFVDANGRAVEYKKVITGTGTAYTAPEGSRTATGREVEVGIVAVDPKVIPYGTRLYIVSADGKHVYGYALAADTGSALKNGDAVVDLFYETESQCLAFGRRSVIVYIL